MLSAPTSTSTTPSPTRFTPDSVDGELATGTPPRWLAFGDFVLDRSSGDLFRDGRPVHLAAQPARALCWLVDRAGELVLRREIQQHVWGDQVIEQEQGLNTCIRQIRNALGDSASRPRFIETIPRRGYRFLAQPRPVPGPEGVPFAADDSAQIPRPLTPDLRLGRGALGFVLATTLVLVLPLGWRGETSEPKEGALAVSPALRTAGPGQGVSSVGVSGRRAAAREAVLQGQYWLNHSPPDLGKAAAEFERALVLDSAQASAHVGLADVAHRRQGPEALALQRRALTTALELDPGLAPAHLRLGRIQLYADWDFEGAGSSFARAVELDPESPEARHAYAQYLSLLRRHDEAIAQAEVARRLDPISTLVEGDGGMVYFNSRRYERAIEVCERTLELAPNHLGAHDCLLNAHRLLGRPGRALQQALAMMTLLGAAESERRPVETASDPEDGLRRFFEWQIGWLERRSASPVSIAAASLPLGRIDEVFVQLERAYDQRASGLLHIAADPRADRFREDPRFVDLLARLGFPQATIER